MSEHLDRLKAMLADDFGTWDLSDKDKDAIRWAVEQLQFRSSGHTALVMTLTEYCDALDSLVKAAEPFSEAASGVPDNWPESCVLTFEASTNNEEHQYANFLKEIDFPHAPTIGQWRKLAKVRDEIFDSFGVGA